MINTTDNIILDKTSLNKLLELKPVDLGRTMMLVYSIRNNSQILADNNNKAYYSDTLCKYLDMETSQFYKFIKRLQQADIIHYGPYKDTHSKLYIFNPLIARKNENRIDSYAVSLFKNPLADLLNANK
jgi:hypothetical protein